MSDPAASPAGPEQLAREAAQWFARLRGPEAETARAEFEAWLARTPEHRKAYNRAAEIFAMGKLLAEDEVAPTPAPRRRRWRVPALAAALACMLVAGSWVALRPLDPATAPQVAATKVQETQTLATIAGETRSVRLPDGSTVALGSGSAVALRFDGTRRLLKLVRGRARFEVAHEARPFTVLAGGGSVTARGTVFEVALAAGRQVDVRLLEGAIDVALPRPTAHGAPPPVRRLHAGESLSFVALEPAAPAPAPSAAAAPSAGTARDYAGVTLAELVAEANRNSTRPIRLADASLGAERVSGRFRIDDTALLARRLAALFDVRADLGDPGQIVLTR